MLESNFEFVIIITRNLVQHPSPPLGVTISVALYRMFTDKYKHVKMVRPLHLITEGLTWSEQIICDRIINNYFCHYGIYLSAEDGRILQNFEKNKHNFLFRVSCQHNEFIFLL